MLPWARRGRASGRLISAGLQGREEPGRADLEERELDFEIEVDLE